MPPDFRPIALDRALALLAEMRGEICWGVRCWGDALLDLEVGEPYLDITDRLEPVLKDGLAVGTRMSGRGARARGLWSIAVEEGQWAASANGLACERPRAEASETCLYYLNGQKIVDVGWDTGERVWRFAFDFGGTIMIRAPLPEDEYAGSIEWYVRCRDRYWLNCTRDSDLYISDRRPAASAATDL